MALVFRRVGRLGARSFDAALYPAFLLGIGNVHVLDADGATVGLPQNLENFAKRGAGWADQRTGAENGAHVCLGQSVIGGIEFGNVRFFLVLERIEVRLAHAEEAVSIDDLQYRYLLAFGSQAIFILSCRGNGSVVGVGWFPGARYIWCRSLPTLFAAACQSIRATLAGPTADFAGKPRKAPR